MSEVALTSPCWWQESRRICFVSWGDTSCPFAAPRSPLGHLSTWPSAGPHLPELARAQDVRREAALCPSGRPAWDPGGVRRGRRGRWEEAWAKLPQSWGHQPERALETGLAFPLAAGNAHTRVTQVNEQTAQARKAGGSRHPASLLEHRQQLDATCPTKGGQQVWREARRP